MEFIKSWFNFKTNFNQDHHDHHQHDQDRLADIELILEILWARKAFAANFDNSLVMWIFSILVKWYSNDMKMMQMTNMMVQDMEMTSLWRSQPWPSVHSDDAVRGHPLAVHLHYQHHRHHQTRARMASKSSPTTWPSPPPSSAWKSSRTQSSPRQELE